MLSGGTALLTDLYQLNMLAAYLDHGLTETAVFELFVRKLPARGGFLMGVGLEQALHYLEALAFLEEDSHASALVEGWHAGYLDRPPRRRWRRSQLPPHSG